MGKSTISMAIFNSYVKLPEGNGYLTPLMFANKWILGEPEQEPRPATGIPSVGVVPNGQKLLDSQTS